eukprot:TRINITY_DN7366_c1_g1_i1.p1 TRINITY_DN7366_c1_g1~~TRINITY_DN7366_c1_g1_i1.p1  ORF type:complete len:116 (-),score=14.89 TRINITY_DN7366_c1_g1_i1:536-883(-)
MGKIPCFYFIFFFFLRSSLCPFLLSFTHNNTIRFPLKDRELVKRWGKKKKKKKSQTEDEATVLPYKEKHKHIRYSWERGKREEEKSDPFLKKKKEEEEKTHQDSRYVYNTKGSSP